MRLIRLTVLLCVLPLALSALASGQTPTLFFTDITSGPATGGENGGGAYVTLYGNYFGASQGASTITLNGQSCLRVVSWGTSWLWYQKIVVQLRSGCSSGNLAVTTLSGSSNTIAFTVRSGNIYCVTTGGSDSNNGKFSSGCWATIPHAAHSMAAGDISYVRNGVIDGADDGYGSPLNLNGESGTAGNPKVLVVYPGETATIGGSGNQRGIIQYPATTNYWTIAGFSMNFPSSPEAVHLYQGSANWRLIANSITCPNGDGFTGCITTDGAPYVDFMGNTIHDTGAVGADKTYHAFYFGDHGTTGNQSIDVGWNTVYNIHGCRGIMFHSIDSTPGAEGYNLKVHDNVVHDTQCDGIALANVNPDRGPILVYNNVLYHVGTGPDPQGQAANYSCLYVGDTNGNPSTPVDAYNNTCYDGGSRGASEGDAGAYTAFIPLRLRNNVTYELSGEAYLTTSTLNQCAGCVRGNNNLWFGVGSGPSQTTTNINADPKFVNIGATNFHLQSGSPAIDSGVTIAGLSADHDGVPRPQGSAYDLGAYEYYTGSGGGNACDLNYDGVVNSSDVQIGISQALGESNCTNGDLDEDGKCTVVDVQRVINAAMGQGCRVGP